MPAATRWVVDNSVGHCYFPRPLDSASPDVFANGINLTRIGDHYPDHTCLVGETRLDVDGQWERIDSLVEDFFGKTTTSFVNGQEVISCIVDAFLTKYTDELIELTFENGQTLRCTPDHLIRLRNGEYKEAQMLTSDDDI